MVYSLKLCGDLIHFGENAVEALKKLSGPRNRAFIVMSGTVLQDLGYLHIVTDALEEAGFIWETFTDVEPEPSFDTVLKGAAVMKTFDPDWVVGFGGGSAMDAAKAMWVFYENPQLKTLEEILPPNRIPDLRKKARVLCIPTTSGTGSEVTRAAVVKDLKKHAKIPIRDMELRLLPDVAILDPKLTFSMPKGLTASSGMDAITHAIESYVSMTANQFTQAMSMSALINAYKYLPLACEDGQNYFYREKMLGAACMGGIAFSNSALGITHSIAHAFGGQFGVPHGMANAIVLPYVIEFNSACSQTAQQYRELAGFIGKENLEEAIKDLNKLIAIPATMSDYLKSEHGFEDKITSITQNALNDVCTNGNPIRPTDIQMKQLIAKVYYGR